MTKKLTKKRPSVLVVCTGNLNRSPFMEAMIRRARPHWRVESAGTSAGALKGARAAAKTRELAAKEYDLDLEGHRARHLSLVLRAGGVPDAVVCFSAAHASAVYNCGITDDRVRMYKVADPGFLRKGSEEFLAVYVALSDLVDQVVSDIEHGN